MQDVLLLNADYRPVRVVHWERAVCMLLQRKARRVADYTDKVIRSESLAIEWPAVVSLVRYARVRTGPKLSRRNLLARDRFTCVYCGTAPTRPGGAPDVTQLTLDHVVPRCRAERGQVVLPWSGARVPVSSWENLVVACAPCNHGKADRTPSEAGLTLKTPPRRPSAQDTLRMALARTPVPPEWGDWI
jgi:5-methylcytosine-specific restriction endonuclease McrA